jgi:hypothetical protein
MRLLEALEGTWEGDGLGCYPTIESFSYHEVVTFAAEGRPFLSYMQRTWATDGRPLHTESGYLRFPTPGWVEWCLAQPTGIVEVLEGELETEERSEDAASGVLAVRLRSVVVGITSSAKSVTATERRLRVVGDELRVELQMEAVGQPMTLHLSSVLRRT